MFTSHEQDFATFAIKLTEKETNVFSTLNICTEIYQYLLNYT